MRSFIHGSGKRVPGRFKVTKIHLALMVALVAVLVWVITLPVESPAQESEASAQAAATEQAPGARLMPSKVRAAAVPRASTGSNASERQGEARGESGPLIPKPMRLAKTVLASKKWNDGPDAFGLEKPGGTDEGVPIGPGAVTHVDGKTYVLDTVNKRVLGFDETGKPLPPVSLPTKSGSDLLFDPVNSKLLVVDHQNDTIYRVEGNEATVQQLLPLKKEYPFLSKFLYDVPTRTIGVEPKWADIEGNNLILMGSGEGPLTIPFDRPVACVEEVVRDPNGITWVLFTLEGDYRMRRLARVDVARGTVGVAEVDTWFAFESSRQMAATGSGVVIFAGDTEEGRLLAFDYAGGAL